MHLVFGNATLVIAASSQSSPDQSIFTRRAPTANFNFHLEDDTFEITVKSRINHDDWSLSVFDYEAYPLLHRAWALQERLLAKRIIHFGRNELVWECKQHLRCECAATFLTHGGASEEELAVRGGSLKTAFSHVLAEKAPQEDVDNTWLTILKEYTDSDLTVTSDRLPALSGIAHHCAVRQGSKYLAGLWLSDLPRTLCWVTRGFPRRCNNYLAPSWSWASTDGRIDFSGRIFPQQPREKSSMEIMEAECTPAGEDPFGQVSDGYLVVKGDFGPVEEELRYHSFDTPYVERNDIWALEIYSSIHLLWKRSERVPGAWERVGLCFRFQKSKKSRITILRLV